MRNIILHSYIGRERADDEIETNQCMDEFRKKYEVVSSMKSWEVQLKEYWNEKANIFMLEHDTCPTVQMLEDMINCKYDRCTQRYVVYKPTTGLDVPMNGNRIKVADENYRFTSLTEMLEFVDLTAFGFVKLGYETRMTIGDKWECPPILLDHTISREAEKYGFKWHQHLELMRHNHKIIDNVWKY